MNVSIAAYIYTPNMEPYLRTLFPSELAEIVADYADQYAVPMGKAKMACCLAIKILWDLRVAPAFPITVVKPTSTSRTDNPNLYHVGERSLSSCSCHVTPSPG